MNPPSDLAPELRLPVLNVGALADLIGVRETYRQAGWRNPEHAGWLRTAHLLDVLISDLREVSRVH